MCIYKYINNYTAHILHVAHILHAANISHILHGGVHALVCNSAVRSTCQDIEVLSGILLWRLFWNSLQREFRSSLESFIYERLDLFYYLCRFLPKTVEYYMPF